MEKYRHLMIDLECLGKPADSAILSIAAVPFEMDGTTGEPFEAFPIVDEQLKYRKIQWSTIQWWMEQEELARQSISSAHRSQTLKECLINLDTFCKTNLDEKFKVWANGASFDTAMMNHAFEQFNLPTPWSYKFQFDCRTMIYLSKISTRKYEPVGTKHNALNDCKWQITWLTDAYNIIKNC